MLPSVFRFHRNILIYWGCVLIIVQLTSRRIEQIIDLLYRPSWYIFYEVSLSFLVCSSYSSCYCNVLLCFELLTRFPHSLPLQLTMISYSPTSPSLHYLHASYSLHPDDNSAYTIIIFYYCIMENHIFGFFEQYGLLFDFYVLLDYWLLLFPFIFILPDLCPISNFNVFDYIL